MRNKSPGQEALEFVLITVLVFFGALLCVVIFGDKLSGFFQTSSSVAQSAKTTVPALTSSDSQKYTPDYSTVDSTYNTLPGEPGGSSENLAMTCDNGSCVMDFGTIVLSDIPENFGSVVEASGASGETQVISSLLEQIAAQLEAKNTPETTAQSDAIKKLSVVGHNIAYIQEMGETLVSKCNGDTDCLRKLGTDRNVTLKDQIPDFNGFDETYGEIDTNWDVTDLMWNISMGSV